VVFDVLYRLLKKLYRRPRHLRAQHHRRRRQDQRRAEGIGRADRVDHRAHTAAYHEDMGALGALKPDIEPRATAYRPR
jgi:cysteinyl-tRNA synthetase